MRSFFKKSLSLLLILCFMSILMPNGMFVFAAPADSDPYTFQDAGSEAVIRAALGGGNDPLTYGDLRNITSLYFDYQKITTWADINECTGLKYLHLYECELPTVAPSFSSSLKDLEIRFCVFSFPLTGMFNGLSDLTYLSFEYNDLTELPAGLFDDLTQLTTLSIAGNKFSSLPNDIFDQLTNLTMLDLSNNHFAALPSDLFSDLNSLSSLQLGYNKSLSLTPGLFDGLATLTYLNLSSCNFSSLPDNIFDNLSALKTLDISGNSFAALPDQIFDELSALETLNFYNNLNPLFSLQNGIFSGLNNLRELYLGSNGFRSLSSGVFAGLSNLKTLDLSYNQFTTLPSGIFANLTELYRLEIRGGELETLPETIFDNLTALNYLYLADNKIETLSAGIFSSLVKLRFLDLSSNRIQTLPNNIFSKQASELLSSGISGLTIDLRSNLLGSLSSYWFGFAPSDNEWTQLKSRLGATLEVYLVGDTSVGLWTDFSVGVGSLAAVDAKTFSHDRFSSLDEEFQELILTLGSLLWKYSPQSIFTTPAKDLVEDMILYGSSLIFKMSGGTVDIKNYDDFLAFLKGYVSSITDIFDGNEELLDNLIIVVDRFLSTTTIHDLLQKSVKSIIEDLIYSYVAVSGSGVLDLIKSQILDAGQNNLDPTTWFGNIVSQAPSLDEAVVQLGVALLGISKAKAEQYYEMSVESVVLDLFNDPNFVLNELKFPIAVQANSILEWAVKFANTILGTNFTADTDCVTIAATIFSMVEPSARYPFIYIWKGIPTGIATQTLTVNPQMDDLRLKSAGIIRPGGTFDPLSFAKSGTKWNVSLPAQNGFIMMRVEMYYEGDLTKYYDLDEVSDELYQRERDRRYYELTDSGMSYSAVIEYLNQHFDDEFVDILAAYLESLRTAEFYFFVALNVPDPELNSMRMSNVNGVIDHSLKTVTFQYSEDMDIRDLIVNSVIMGVGNTYQLSNDGKDFSGSGVTLTVENFDGSKALVYQVIVEGGSIVLNTPKTGDDATGFVLCFAGLFVSTLTMCVLWKKRRRVKNCA